MSTTYVNNERGKTSGIPLSSVSGLGDKKLCRLTFHVKMESSATAGWLYFTFKWKDRDGVTQTWTSPAGLPVAGMSKIGDVVPFWTEDSGGAGAYFAYEITAVSVIGSYSYAYFVEVDEICTEI